MPSTVARETIDQALLGLVNKASKFRTVTRKFKMWNEYGIDELPALLLIKGDEEAQPAPRGMPTRWTLNYDLVMYTYQEEGIDTSPMPTLNELLDAVEAIFQPDTTDQGVNCTLGGLVHHAWIEGGTEMYEGMLSGHSVVIVPIKVLAN